MQSLLNETDNLSKFIIINLNITKENNEKIIKTLLVSIASLSLMFSVNAGELTVTGTAKATYNSSSGVSADQGLRYY